MSVAPSAGAARPTAVIFRKRLLPWSETFIAQQGRALRRYEPLFAGYRYREGGRDYLVGSPSTVLADHVASLALGKASMKLLGRLPSGWRDAIAEREPRIVHAHFGVNAIAALPIARAFGVPLVVTYHGMDITVERSGWSARRRRGRVFDSAARLIAVSEFIRERLVAAGAPLDRLVVHRIGVDTEHFSPGESERDGATVLFVGRLVAKKGLIHLLRAMRRVVAAVPKARVLIAGDGVLREAMEKRAVDLGVAAEFLGVRSPLQVRDLMRRATVFAAPSVVAPDGNAEGLPMTIVEAQACGLPVVGFPSGGSAEGVLEGETGFMVEPRDEAALADRLIGLLTDPDARAAMSAAARAHALRSFDLGRQTALLEDMYDEVRRSG